MFVTISHGDGASAPTGLAQSGGTVADAPGDAPAVSPAAEAEVAEVRDDTQPGEAARPERTHGTTDGEAETDDAAVAAAPEAGSPNGTSRH